MQINSERNLSVKVTLLWDRSWLQPILCRILTMPMQPSLVLYRPFLVLAIAGMTLAPSLWFSGRCRAQAQPPATPQTTSPATAPLEVKQLLAQIDAAASKRDLAGVMKRYPQEFTHSDGLNRQTLEQTLKSFWQEYQTLNYQTELLSWQPQGTGYWIETRTTITGTQQLNGRDLALKATLHSRQRLQNGKILRQEILAEQSQITSGKNPPTVEVRLPAQVGVGREFNFDVVIKEPLGNSLVLGAALQEPINPKSYLQKPTLKLEPLASGGLFKVGRAPNQPTSTWISAVLIREGGLVLLSQRLNVVARP